MNLLGMKSFDELLAWTCAPVLLGRKSSNLVCVPLCEKTDITCILQNYKDFFQSRDIEYRVMCFCHKRALVLIYNRPMLIDVLNDKGNRAFLIANGYNIQAQIDNDLDILEKHMMSSKEFPHEIGVFLGYPLEDVLGFVLHKDAYCKHKGYWKVYGDVNKAKEIFNSYERYKDYLLKKIAMGTPLAIAIEQFKEVV